jgi:hypothetical protein
VCSAARSVCREKGLPKGADVVLARDRRGNVLESGTALEEPALDGGVSAGGGPMGADARVPQDVRRLGEVEVLGWISQQDGAAVEQQFHGQSVTRVRVPARSYPVVAARHAF